MTGIIKRIFTPHVEAEPVWQSELFVFCYVFHLIILISLCDYAICIDGFGVNVSPLIILYCTCAWATYNEHRNWDHTYYEYAKNKRRWTMKEKSRQLDAITYTKHGDASSRTFIIPSPLKKRYIMLVPDKSQEFTKTCVTLMIIMMIVFSTNFSSM